MDDEEGSDDWTIVRKGSKLNAKNVTVPNYVQISNRYATLPAFSAPPDPIQHPDTPSSPPIQHQSRYRLKIERRRKAKLAQQIKQLCENEFFDTQITRSEDERTSLAKDDTANVQRVMIDTAHSASSPTSLTFLQLFLQMPQLHCKQKNPTYSRYIRRHANMSANMPAIYQQ